MEVKTLAQLKATAARDNERVGVRDTRQQYVYLRNRPDLTIDDEEVFETPVASDRWVAEKAVPTTEGGGGGGGSAYPEPLLFVTEDDQGFIYIAGGKPKLPATAANGTTFKFGGSPTDMIIDTNGNTVAGYGNDANLKIGSQYVHLVAINIPGPALIWTPANRRYIDNYYADAAYAEGDMVQDGASRYICLSDYSVGDPLTDADVWRPIPAVKDHVNVTSSPGRSFATDYTAAKDLFLTISVDMPSCAFDGDDEATADLLVDGESVARLRNVAVGGFTGVISTMIPVGSTYRLNRSVGSTPTDPFIHKWVEQELY